MSRGLTVVSRLRSVSFRSLIFRNGSQTRAGEAELPAPDLRLFWKVPENRNSSPPGRPRRSPDRSLSHSGLSRTRGAPYPRPALRSGSGLRLGPRAPDPHGSSRAASRESRARRSPRSRAPMQIGHVTAKAAWPSPVPQSIYGQ